MRPDPDGSISPERFAEAIDERTALVCCTTLSYRSGHRHDVAGDRGGRARRRRARARRQLPGVRRGRARRPVARRRRRHGRHGEVPARDGRTRVHVGAAEVCEALLPTQTGWFADEDIFAMSIADYSPHRERPPVRLRHAARARALRGGRGNLASLEDAGVAADRGARPRLSSTGCSTGSTSSARRSRRRASPLGAARSSASARPTSTRSSPRSRRSASSRRRARTTCASRSTSTTSRRTSTASSTRSPVTGRSSR